MGELKDNKVYLNIQNSHDLMPDGLDIFIVLTIWSRTFKGDLREREREREEGVEGAP